MPRALTRVKLNGPAVRRLLNDPKVAADLVRRGRQIARAAGAGHEVTLERGPSRVRVEVRTTTPEAMWREARHRSLTRAVDAGRR